jgi:hypothetical protein
MSYLFDVHDSEHLGNIYVQFKVQLDIYFYVFFILSCICFGCYLHLSSGAQLQRTAIGFVWFWYVSPLKQVLVGTPSH